MIKNKLKIMIKNKLKKELLQILVMSYGAMVEAGDFVKKPE